MARAKGGHRRNKNDRTKFKWTKELIFLLCGLGAAIIIMIICLIPTSKTSFYNKYVTDSNALNKDNVFEEISYENLKKKIENKEMVYVFYSTDLDATCKTNIGILDYYTNKHQKTTENTHYDVDKVYVLDAKFAYELNEDDSNQLAKFNEKEDYFNSKRADKIKELDLKTYSQLWVFDAGEMVFSSETVIGDNQASATFRTCVIKAFSYKENKEAK